MKEAVHSVGGWPPTYLGGVLTMLLLKGSIQSPI